MNKKVRIVSLCVIFILLALVLKFLLKNEFSSVEDFQAYIDRFGITGSIVLVFFQAFQVVVPVLPGYFGCAVGAITFGTEVGFLCNYIGICAGSIMAYILGRKYGISIVKIMFPEKTYNKWRKKIEKSKSYERFLFVATVLPLFPDDFLCYFSGIIKMERRKFIWIILLGKPWCIMAYSILFGMIK
ncbi:MAG: VTT domain-containing protein [Lachnospiraceae bacterium]|nr:VTT domain-containing protein [Lachnospiraceae bacterium]